MDTAHVPDRASATKRPRASAERCGVAPGVRRGTHAGLPPARTTTGHPCDGGLLRALFGQSVPRGVGTPVYFLWVCIEVPEYEPCTLEAYAYVQRTHRYSRKVRGGARVLTGGEVFSALRAGATYIGCWWRALRGVRCEVCAAGSGGLHCHQRMVALFSWSSLTVVSRGGTPLAAAATGGERVRRPRGGSCW